MITVLQPGLFSTIQDEGRPDYLAYGLPRAGVMDRYASRMANLLCGNPLSAALIEMTMTGVSLRFEQPCRIAICGAAMSPRLNTAVIDLWDGVDVQAGDILEMSYAQSGCRSYLAISGGIETSVILGSRSTYTRANIGGINGRQLRVDDRFSLGELPPVQVQPIKLDCELIPVYTEDISLRVLLGPQDDLFLPEGIQALITGEYRITDEADRMGYRLEGPLIRHVDKADIVSDALCSGAIQVPGNGQPIVMMADCGTTGGYTKIATVIAADLWKLAQAKPQDRVRFVLCSESEAVQALAEEREKYRRVARQVSVGPSAPLQAKATTRAMQLKIQNQNFMIKIEEVK
jgi:biotin-dependent carboxylase-like uncharacterized protein